MPYWFAIQPVAGTNLVANPSAEYTATGWAGTDSATASRIAGSAQYGGWSMTNGITGGAGIVYGTVTMPAGSYTVSVSVRAPAGSVYSIGMKGTGAGAAFVGSVAGTTGGTWHRYSFSYGEAAPIQRFFAVVRRQAGATDPFTVDGLQVESGTFQTTYIDGDQEGCFWTGAAHASPSTRSGTSRQGGTVVSLQSLGLTVLEMGGIGMPSVANITQEYAIADGALFQRQRATARVFTLTSLFSGTTWPGLHAIRSGIVDLFKIDRTPNPQPTRLLYTGAGGTSVIDAYYDGGMTMESRAGFSETTAVRLIAPDPYWYAATDAGTALAPQAAFPVNNRSPTMQRAPTGVWGTLGGQMLDGAAAVVVTTMFYSPTGTLFVGGRFQTIAGTTTVGVAMWLPATQAWGSLSGGTLGTTATREGAQAFAWQPGGTLFVGGDFGPIAGTAQRYLAQWTGAWGTVGAGTVNTPVDALAYNPEGTLFVGGTHTVANGTTAYGVAQWTGAGWGTLTGGTVSGAAPAVRALLWGADNALYVGGSFSNVAGTVAHGLGRWNGAWGTFGSISAGDNTNARSIVQDANGVIYVGGNFGSVNTTAARNIAAWNGAQWRALGQGVGTAGDVVADALASGGIVLATGGFSTAGGIPVPTGAARWNQSAWLPNDAFFTTGNIQTIAVAPDTTLYIAGNMSGSATCAAVTTVINAGGAIAYPVITMRNTGTLSSRITQLVNYATGDAVYFNLSIQGGETIALDLRNSQKTLVSDVRGNMLGAVLPGSNLTTWRLTPGTNYVSFFAYSGSVEATLAYRARAWSVDPRL